jgi:HicB family
MSQRLQFRLPPALYAKLEEEAIAQGLSIHQYAIAVLSGELADGISDVTDHTPATKRLATKLFQIVKVLG